MNEKEILDIIRSDSWKMEALEAVRSLNLSDWLIGAGFVRNATWDALHGYDKCAHSTDIDVAYFDDSDLSEETETKYQNALRNRLAADWSVTNQARMAKTNNQVRDYTSTEDAIAHWPETATAIGVTLTPHGDLKLIAPYGIEDLASLNLRMTPEFGDGVEAFKARVAKKEWLLKWPLLKVVGIDSPVSDISQK
jgi:uncharacterized protein